MSSPRREIPAPAPADCRGFTLVEVLIAGVLLALALLAMSGLFVTGYANVAVAGKTTIGLAAARQILEEARGLPFDSLSNLDDFDTDDPSSLPADDPEREVARRWRYTLAGDGPGWSFTDAEIARWPQPPEGTDTLGATGTIDIVLEQPTLARVTITIAIPGSWRTVEMSTLVAGS
jgi:Tfp pilus assembly protein PilV